MEETVTSGAIEMSWDPAARLALIRFNAETHATGRDAEILVQALDRWIGKRREPFAVLGNGENLAGVDAEYRARWSRFLQEHRQEAIIAFFNMNMFIRIAAEMFGIGARLQVKAFAREEEARGWLRELGIAG